MSNLSIEQKLHYTLRFGVAMCFIGHGAFGIITKPIWANYFAVFGINHDWAFRLMPITGAFDILLGIIMLIRPMRAIALWLVIWGLVTASLRPLSGEPFAELIERAGNFGAPIALLILSGGIKNIRELFTPINPNTKLDIKRAALLLTCLQIVAFLLLAGHGWLNLVEKRGLLEQYSRLGFTSLANTAHIVGTFEVIAGLLILIRPLRPVLFLLLVWKIATELFYPHYEVFEWVERGGSYCTLLALWFITEKTEVPNLFFFRTTAKS
jgi:hypothetical protein